MAKQRKSSRRKSKPHKKFSKLEKILLATAILNFLAAAIELVNKLL